MSMTSKAQGAKKKTKQAKPPTAVVDPNTYARCSTPRPVAVANQAALDFIADTQALREKHGIADVVWALRVVTDAPELESLCMCGFRGSQSVAVTLSQMTAEKTRADYEALAQAVLEKAT